MIGGAGDPKYITITVGGKAFVIHQQSLTLRGGMILRILEETKDHVIDRDPKLFTYILEYIHTSGVSVVAEADSVLLRKLLIEAKFFRLFELETTLQLKLKTVHPVGSIVRLCDIEDLGQNCCSSETCYCNEVLVTKSLPEETNSIIQIRDAARFIRENHLTDPIRAARLHRFKLSPDLRKNIFSWEEIRKHTHANDCWLVVGWRVLDVTEFLDVHPAGKQSILRHASEDCTQDFDFHSDLAQSLWITYQIGVLEGATIPSRCIIM